jgi:glycerol kinase
MLQHHHEVRDAHEQDDLMFGTVDSWLVYNLTGGVKGGKSNNAYSCRLT